MYNFTMMSETQEAMGLSNRDIANATSLSESTVSRIMSGTTKDPSADVLCDICDVLHLSLDVVMGRDAMAEVPAAAGENLTENLVIIRDFVRRNFERLRTIEHEKDAAFNRHIDHLKEQLDNKSTAATTHVEHLKQQLDKYSSQFRRYNNTIIALICVCGILLGIMITMFINNRALSAQVRDLQESIVTYHHEQETADDFPAE